MIGQRRYSDVRIWRGAQPVGVGFVLDQDHVMTCAHVVVDALKPDARYDQPDPPAQELTIDFPALDPRGGGNRMSRTAHVTMWRCKTLDDVRDDIAILKLTAPIPPEIVPVTACLTSQEGDPFKGYGVTSNNPEGKVVAGTIVDALTRTRYQIVSDTDDDAVAAGCSGGAAWNVRRGGIAGMIVSRKLTRSGEIIPIEWLRRIHPIPEYRDFDRRPAEQAAQARPTSQIRRRLEEFDREPQFGDFELALDEIWERNRRAVTCILCCCDDDRPDVLQRRFLAQSLRARFEAVSVSSDRLRAEQIAWPNRSRLIADHELQSLKAQFRRFLPSATALTAADFRKAYEASLQPLALYSKIEARYFDESHIELLDAWLAFWAEVAQFDLKKPLVAFVRFHFDGSAGEAAMRTAFERFRAETSELGPRALPELAAFEQADIVEWLGAELDSRNLGEFQIEAEQSLAEHMKGRAVRLGSLLEWASRLPY